MKTTGAALLGLALVLACFGFVSAGEVKVTGVHICCGQCVKLVSAALKDVPGVSGVVASQNDHSVTYQAADDAAAAAGIEALAKGGFHGTAKHGDKALSFPASGAEKDQKADEFTLAGIHLCCPACYTAADKAFKSVAGVTATADKATKTYKVSGKGVDVNAVVKALNDAGFHATVKK